MSFLEFLIFHFAPKVSLVKPLPYRYTSGSLCRRFWVEGNDEVATMKHYVHEVECQDCQEELARPLWYDDASYIAYQSYDGEDYLWNEARNEPWRVSLVHGARQSKIERAAYSLYQQHEWADYADVPF